MLVTERVRGRLLVEGLDHPEGVAWDPGEGVVWAGGEAGQLYRVGLDGSWDEVARAPGFVLGLAVDGRGRIVLCCRDAGVHVWDGERVRPVLDAFAFANFPAFAPDGTLYVSDSGRWRQDNGRIVRLAPDGARDIFTEEPRHFTNGVAVSPDGRFLWIAESHEPRIGRLDVRTAEYELVARLGGTVPDGLAFTADGGVLVSCYRPDRIYHLAVDGTLQIVADDYQGTLLGAPTNVCFAGDNLDLVVCANLGRWHLTLLDLELRGAPLHAPERWAIDA